MRSTTNQMSLVSDFSKGINHCCFFLFVILYWYCHCKLWHKACWHPDFTAICDNEHSKQSWNSLWIQWIWFLKWISQNLQLMWHLKTPSLQPFCRLNLARPHIKFLVFSWDFFVDEERQSRSISSSTGQTFSWFCVSLTVLVWGA